MTSIKFFCQVYNNYNYFIKYPWNKNHPPLGTEPENKIIISAHTQINTHPSIIWYEFFFKFWYTATGHQEDIHIKTCNAQIHCYFYCSLCHGNCFTLFCHLLIALIHLCMGPLELVSLSNMCISKYLKTKWAPWRLFQASR